MGTAETIAIENAHMPPFFAKTPISIDRGEGVYVWEEEGNGIRVFPSLNIEKGQLMEGLATLHQAIKTVAREKR
jgi:acetylornithine/succinyldiaminopimelate/putrescine aminotransferase